MNNTGFRELAIIFSVLLLLIAIVFYFFRLKAASFFFLIFSVLLAAWLVISPITYKKETKSKNAEIAGIYRFSFIDSSSKYEMRDFEISKSCKMILYPEGRFHIQNCPSLLKIQLEAGHGVVMGTILGYVFQT